MWSPPSPESHKVLQLKMNEWWIVREKFLLWEGGGGGERDLIKNDRGLKVYIIKNFNLKTQEIFY